MPTFKVTVSDTRIIDYYIEAETAEDAEQLLQAADCDEYQGAMVDGSWEIIGAERCQELEVPNGSTD